MSSKLTGSGPASRKPGEQQLLRARPQTVFDVQVVPRGRRWKWLVRNQLGEILMQGWERSRPLASYQGYSALLLLLRASCLRAPLCTSKDESAARQTRATEKGRPVARTAFPVSRRRHI